MEKVKITKVFSSDKKKDGTPFKTRDGKPFWKVVVRVSAADVPSDVWISKLVFSPGDPALSLKENDEVKLKIWQDGDNGYWNFDFPKPEDEAAEKIDSLEARVVALEEAVLFGKKGETKEAEPVPQEEPVEELPF